MASFLSHVSVVENKGLHLTSSGTTPEKQLEHPSLAYNSRDSECDTHLTLQTPSLQIAFELLACLFLHLAWQTLFARKNNHWLVGPSEQSILGQTMDIRIFGNWPGLL
jgi:hypothetical protein